MVHTHAEPEPQHRNKNEDTAAAAAARGGGGGGKSETTRRRLVPFCPPLPRMAMIPERANPKPLHNFTLPRLRWGNQKFMRCMKVADHSSTTTSSASASSISAVHHRRSEQQSAPLVHRSTRFAASPEEDGIDAVREKLMLDLRTETDKIKKELLKGDEEEEDEADEEERKVGRAAAAGRREEDEAAETRPWNLRTRRAACRAPVGKEDAEEEKVAVDKEKEREKFSVALKRKEIEEDFMKLTGHRPARRPKKRSRSVQKQLDMLFPGLWLTEITADAYKVVEAPDNGKR